MLISHTHRFLLVHVPKTAGSSVTASLQPFCDQPKRVWFNRMYPTELFQTYYKFAFVRNPWDLMVSYYHFIQSRPEHHRNPKVQSLDSFEEYLAYEIKQDKISQTRFLMDANGELLVDYVGRCEGLAKQWRQDMDQSGYAFEGEG